MEELIVINAIAIAIIAANILIFINVAPYADRLGKRLAAAIRGDKHCCRDFAYHVDSWCWTQRIPLHVDKEEVMPRKHDKYECPDCILISSGDGYGIPIHDGGSSFIVIKFCPWCGSALSGKSKPKGGKRSLIRGTLSRSRAVKA